MLLLSLACGDSLRPLRAGVGADYTEECCKGYKLGVWFGCIPQGRMCSHCSINTISPSLLRGHQMEANAESCGLI